MNFYILETDWLYCHACHHDTEITECSSERKKESGIEAPESSGKYHTCCYSKMGLGFAHIGMSWYSLFKKTDSIVLKKRNN